MDEDEDRPVFPNLGEVDHIIWTDTGQGGAFKPEGPFCDLTVERREVIFMPASLQDADFVAQRTADVARWKKAIDDLRKSTESGRIPEKTAFMLLYALDEAVEHH